MQKDHALGIPLTFEYPNIALFVSPAGAPAQTLYWEWLCALKGFDCLVIYAECRHQGKIYQRNVSNHRDKHHISTSAPCSLPFIKGYRSLFAHSDQVHCFWHNPAITSTIWGVHQSQAKWPSNLTEAATTRTSTSRVRQICSFRGYHSNREGNGLRGLEELEGQLNRAPAVLHAADRTIIQMARDWCRRVHWSHRDTRGGYTLQLAAPFLTQFLLAEKPLHRCLISIMSGGTPFASVK